jgi:hypothetical protein
VAEGAGGPADGGDSAAGGILPILAGALLVLGGLAVGVWWLFVREDGQAGASAPRTGEASGEPPAPATSAGESDEVDDGPPPELLSNEERVLRLLDQHGGRIKQQQVAGELDWTDAKTSQVVSELREAGELESFRLGRENVLTLPDVSLEPDAGESGDEAAGDGDS